MPQLFVGTDAASIRVYNAESRSFVHEFGSDSAYPWCAGTAHGGCHGAALTAAWRTYSVAGTMPRMGEVQCSPAEPVIVAAGWTGAPKGEVAVDREGVLAGWNLRSMGSKVRWNAFTPTADVIAALTSQLAGVVALARRASPYLR